VVEADLAEGDVARFPWFDPEPLASASLGQVHRARLPSGEQVVVKVQRPGIEQILAVDLKALGRVVAWLGRVKGIRRRADLQALLAEFSKTLWAELDYLAEGENARRFARMFSKNPAVRIPKVHLSHTTRRVLTLEDVYFIKITDYSAIEAAGVSRAEVAQRLFKTYLTQIFRRGFFHADPHPGNLFVEAGGEQGWRLVFVDFGMVGRLNAQAMQGLRELAVAVGARDVDRLLRAYQTLGMILPGADLGRLRQAEEALFERLWGRSMRELAAIQPREMREFSHQFRDLLYELPFQVPTDLIFLGRCVAILSGMCTGLNPDFNLFQETARRAARPARFGAGEGRTRRPAGHGPGRSGPRPQPDAADPGHQSAGHGSDLWGAAAGRRAALPEWPASLGGHRAGAGRAGSAVYSAPLTAPRRSALRRAWPGREARRVQAAQVRKPAKMLLRSGV
jgi:predicted unusual protein kinase regulating ubiquinone biosynthesis (AarF/ABC1/UbiB family)